MYFDSPFASLLFFYPFLLFFASFVHIYVYILLATYMWCTAMFTLGYPDIEFSCSTSHDSEWHRPI